MVLYSPQHEGGTLHLPSPTHCHTFDATSTLLQLRRSLSRSPSKSPAFRLVTTKPHSPSARSALSPSPLSPYRHVSRLQLPGIASTHDATAKSPPHSPLGIDMPASQRTTRASVRKYSPLRTTTNSRAHLIGRTPGTRRALGESIDSGNVIPTVAQEFKLGAENAPTFTPSASIVQPPKVDFKGFGADQIQITSLDSTAQDNTLSTTPQSFNFRGDKQHSNHLTEAPVKSSPLKRTDGPSKTDPTEGASPSAKRRSLHGASDFDIFDQFISAQQSNTPRTSPEYVTMPATVEGPPKKIPQISPVQKRTNSLRKTTLQQRHQDRPMLNRSKANTNFAQTFAGLSPAPPQPSIDRNLRRNLFFGEDQAAPGNVETTMEPPRAPARHPLSRTMTQSSSGSEPAQDSPTHIPPRALDRRPQLSSHFARSLPIGHGKRAQIGLSNGIPDNSDIVTSTPQTFKDAKPLQQPFMSTGLISKRTKHLQDQSQGEVKHMPDTPCKKPMPINPLAPGSTPAPAPRHTELRRSQHSFGSPSTPFAASTAQPSAEAVGKGVSIFGSTVRPLNRRGSFLRVDSEDIASGASTAGQSFEAPPTPNREHASIESMTPDAGSFNFRTSVFGPAFNSREEYEPTEAADSPQPDVSCKFVLNSPDGFTIDADGDSMMQESPSAHRKFNSLGALSSYSGHRRPSILAGDHSPSPTPQSRKSHTLPHIRTSNLNLNAGAPASPLFERSEHKPPCTPRDGRASVAPPDPSGLSISGQAHQTVDFRKSTLGQSTGFGSMPPPATPTANRDSSRFHSSRVAPTTSVQAHAEAAADLSLRERFDSIKVIGEGEFSTVFEVSRKRNHEQISAAAYFDSPPNASSLLSMRPPRSVWAVKKSRHPFKSKYDRNRKLKEAEILRKLGRSDHTIQFEDCWEHDQHLYIQTEFCEEGSLDKFLTDCGCGARLDDFRVWKILLEISLGVKYIHDKGFIHLDLKPANILISFEGTLKIADFGLATSWPAQRGIDGEGDREYIGPEILRGKFDKPADVFALGMIMFEIAGNVVLPDNGPHWQRLRSGDMSDVGSLTSSSEASLSIHRDISGRVIEEDGQAATIPHASMQGTTLTTPPDFMASKEDANSLDQMVSWMINPEPKRRPTADDLLTCVGVQWVAGRRRAGATIYEGIWGPADDTLAQDAEMMDV